MYQKIYQVDAFTAILFKGNPAAVCPLDEWIDDNLMQNIAMENNLSETVFYVKYDDGYQIRWFTPNMEVDLCGHATLAASFVLFNYEGHTGNEIRFYSLRSGQLYVRKDGDFLTMNFPSDIIVKSDISPDLSDCFDIKSSKVFKGKTDYVFLFDNEDVVRNIVPNFEKISKLNARGVIITSKGIKADFVSRFFGPQSGVDEDPVTGSAHTTLSPYWAEKLNRNELQAVQVSARTGHLRCKYLDDRVEISGQAVLFMKGEIFL